MSKKIVTNNLKALLEEKGRPSKWVQLELKRIGYPVNPDRFSRLLQNKTEIYFREAILIAAILKLETLEEVVNGEAGLLIYNGEKL